jgi:hypothetical protein
LGLDIVSLEDKISRMPKRPLMVGKNKDDGIRDPLKIFLEESLTQQRNKMMDSFLKILWWIPTRDTSSLSRGVAPFKVRINFDIPIFEVHIDANSIDKWLNILEGYFFVHNFLNRENITFALLKVIPHVKDWWESFVRKKKQRNPHYLQSWSPGSPSGMLLSNNTTLSEVMTTCIQNGPHHGKKETKQCQSSQIYSIPCATIWVSKILRNIWFSSIIVVYIDKSKPKWSF